MRIETSVIGEWKADTAFGGPRIIMEMGFRVISGSLDRYIQIGSIAFRDRPTIERIELQMVLNRFLESLLIRLCYMMAGWGLRSIDEAM